MQIRKLYLDLMKKCLANTLYGTQSMKSFQPKNIIERWIRSYLRKKKWSFRFECGHPPDVVVGGDLQGGCCDELPSGPFSQPPCGFGLSGAMVFFFSG